MQFTVVQLKEQAKSLGIQGFAQMNKAALIEAIAKVAPPIDQRAVESATEQQAAEKWEDPALKVESYGPDFQNHPKFDKFKKSQGDK